MKLESLTLKNFRAYKGEVKIRISDLTAFIGKNDIGKSSILEALDIFFNNDAITCSSDDKCIDAEGTEFEISCSFSKFPSEIVIDATASTSLESEYLLNSDGQLEIKKIYPCNLAKIKEKTMIHCIHPSAEGCKDLLLLKRPELKKRADGLGVNSDTYNASISSQIRKAIWNHVRALNLVEQEIQVDAEDVKAIYTSLSKYLPTYALFQSDRTSRDDDKEVTDPMKLAINQALVEQTAAIEQIKDAVRESALATACRTLAKLNEMAPDIAKSLIPEFKAEPKFDSQFKLTIKSDNDIPLNRRGSGVRRLVLLNFFRAEAEKRMQASIKDSIIYAFEEPETSQHPNHQRMLLDAFLALSNTPNCQIILTTHTPSIGGLLPIESLRYVTEKDGARTVEDNEASVLDAICQSLGILPEPFSSKASAVILVEGKSDITFLNHICKLYKGAGYIDTTFQDKNMAIVPTGGCDNLKHWYTMKIIDQFGLPWCVLLDSDIGSQEFEKNQRIVNKLREKGIKAYSTRKREPENYIDIEHLRNYKTPFLDTDDAKCLIAGAEHMKKDDILEIIWPRMTFEQVRMSERYFDGGNEKFEFFDIINDFLSIV